MHYEVLREFVIGINDLFSRFKTITTRYYLRLVCEAHYFYR